MNQNTTILVAIIAVIIASGAGFFGGMKYQEVKGRSNFETRMIGGANGGRMMQFRGGPNGGNGGFRPVTGEILSKDNNSITVKLPDGSSKIVLLSDKTSINKSSDGSKDDLKTGEKVLVIGTANSDGSVSAQNIQLNPQMGGFMRRLSPTGTQ